MNDTLKRALQNRKTTKVIYDEPIAGIDIDGKEITCNRQIIMTVEDVISVQRSKHNYNSEEDALMDFIVVYWAWLKFEGKGE